MLRKKAVAFLLFLFILGSASAVPEAWRASAHNIGISGSLLGSNMCGFEEREPSEGDAFSSAGIRAVTLVPQIDNITSDLANPQLVWSWTADAPASAVFPLPGTTECPGGELRLFNRSAISFSDAAATYRFGKKETVAALSGTGPNPMQLELNASGLDERDFTGLYANLSIRLSAKASVSYSFSKKYFRRACDYYGNFTVCYCEEKYALGRKSYEKALFDERNFSVEVGPVSEFYLNPPLQTRLDGSGTGKVVFFARRMPAKISAAVDGAEIASAEPYKFEMLNGSCGEMIVKSKYAPSGTNAHINKSNATAMPRQLVQKNASYLPFYLEFNWSESAGKKALSLEYEDWFSHSENFTREFAVRRPDAFASNASEAAVAIRTGDDKSSPAAYPSPEKTGVLPNAAPLAALLAVPCAIGAYGLLLLARKLH